MCKMATKQSVKTWGEREFWGLNWDFDPQWMLSEKQKEIQKKLIETCKAVIRPNAVSNASLQNCLPGCFIVVLGHSNIE